jgi:hypothetical protein
MIKEDYYMRISLEERINKAIEESSKKPKSKDEICNLVKEAIKIKEIYGKPEIVELCNIKKFQIPKTIKDNKDSVVFIQFSKSGHVAVVGAGKDYVAHPLYRGRERTAIIMENLRKRSNYVDFQFDVDSVIIIPIENLESWGNNIASSILKSRNGVEQYIGEYLEKKV